MEAEPITCKKKIISFTVLGQPRPQGSKISHALYDKQGKPVMKGKRVVVITRNDCDELKNWRNQVADKAAAAYKVFCPPDENGQQPLISVAVSLKIWFFRMRLKGHYGTGKNAGKLKPSAPIYPTTSPDELKLARAVEDALSGVVLVDDNQIRQHIISEVYGERYETHVTIAEL